MTRRRWSPVVFGVLRRMTPAELSRLPDLSEGLENRIYAAIRQAAGLGEVHTLAKSKRYTAARIRRVVTSAFLGLDDSYGAGGYRRTLSPDSRLQ